MAMLIRRSAVLLRRTGAPLVPASRQAEVIPSLAATFLSSSSAAGAAARSAIRSKGHRMFSDGSGSTRTQVGGHKPMFLGENERSLQGTCGKSISELEAMQRKLRAITDHGKGGAGTRAQLKDHAA